MVGWLVCWLVGFFSSLLPALAILGRGFKGKVRMLVKGGSHCRPVCEKEVSAFMNERGVFQR